MNTRMLGPLVFLSVLILDPAVSEGALYRRALTIDRTGGLAMTDIQVPVVLTPANFDYSHVEPSGQLIRFTDADQLTALTCYRESWSPGGTSIFWIRVPNIPAGSVKTVYLYHSTSPGELTPTSSDFAATFPNRYVLSAGSAQLTGNLSYDWFQIDAPATALVAAEVPLSVTARRAVIHGTIQARGSGHTPNPNAFTNGLGPGGGQASFGASGGGGGYGGQGGAGYFNFASPLPAYGTPGGGDISMGSSGATGGNPSFPGGAGGGAVTITAQRLDVTGTVDARGNEAPAEFGQAGSGGGSGGGVLLRAFDLRVSGTITADGGDAGIGGGGGGGGGGRVKLLYENSSAGIPTLSASGGDGDIQFPAGSGAVGSMHTGSGLPFDEVVASVGPEVGLVAVESGALEAVRVGPPTPNPSRGQVAFRIHVDRPMSLSAEIVDVQGRRVKCLVRDDALSAGAHELLWDHTDEAGGAVAVGIYLANVTLGGQTWTRRIAVFR